MKNLHPSLWMDDHINVHAFFNDITESYTELFIADFEEVKAEPESGYTQITLQDEIEERTSSDFDPEEDNVPI